MDNNMMELNLNEMEMVNGGINWGRVFGVGWTTAMVGAAAATLTILAASTPVGWVATGAALAGSMAVGGTIGGGITAAIEAIVD